MPEHTRKVLVCGGRDYSNRARVFKVLDKEHGKEPIGAIVHGAAPGADSLAGEWARERGVEEIAVPAEWVKFGSKAGPIRNAKMLREHRPDLVVAFPGGFGTEHMKRIARETRMVRVLEIIELDGVSDA